MISRIRTSFITGLMVILPIGVTLIVINFLLLKVGDPSSKIFFFFLDDTFRNKFWRVVILNTASLLIIITLITLIGFISRYFLGRMVIMLTEKIVNAVPGINTVYSTVKQIVTTFSEQKKNVFQKTVLVEYPRRGMYAVGFLTSDAEGEVQYKTEARVLNIFLPTTPNPTSGYLIMVPEDDVIDLSMSVAEGMKLIISGGAVVPPYQHHKGSDALESKE